MGCGSLPDQNKFGFQYLSCIISYLKHILFFRSLFHLSICCSLSLCWHNTGWGWLVLCLLQIGHSKSSTAELWTSLRWSWQPACPSHIQKDRAGLVSSRCCLHQKLCRVSNLWFHTCRNNTVLSALKRMFGLWQPRKASCNLALSLRILIFTESFFPAIYKMHSVHISHCIC